jgi:C1A family cysteine protease
MKRVYNLKIDRVPHTELKFKTFKKVPLPEAMDLRNNFPPIYDQGVLGSCTANALCAVHEFETIDENIDKGFKPSRLFLYYNERKIEGTISEDSGALLSDGIRSLKQYGVCSESYCPYIIENFTQQPSAAAYKEALEHKVVVSSNIQQDLTTMKLSLVNKNPFVVGIAIYSSFESPEVGKTGMVPMPKKGEQFLGGHAVVVCGYTKDHWIMRNSWGQSWGDKGYFYLPYLYLLDSKLSSDLWNISKIE